MITASNFREVVRNTLRGFCTLVLLPSGIVLHGCAYHQRDNQRWISLPSKSQIDSDGRQRRDLVTNKVLWTPVVEIRGKAERERFQAAALAAIDKLLGQSTR